MRLVLAAAALVTLAGAPAFAQSVVYSGMLTCEAAPSANLRASSVQATVTRQGNTVTFERPI